MNLIGRFYLPAIVLLSSGTLAQATTLTVLKDNEPVATIEVPPGAHMEISGERIERYSEKHSRFSGNIEASVVGSTALNNEAEASAVHTTTAPVVIRAEVLDVNEAQ